MKLLLDFFPLILFFVAYKYTNIFIATAVAIAASVIQVIFYWSRKKRFEPTHIITLAVIVIFGGMTLIFRDDTFIKWKPTIVEWIFALIVLGSQLIGRRTAIEFLLGSQIQLPPRIWKNVNLAWGLFFLLVGALNLYVAFFFRLDLDEATRTDIWVNFKVFGLMGLTLLFTIAQMALIAKHIQIDEK
ncbi:MAG: septation protein A [Acidiferrobacteraceae bacterium]|nr:septation protein A [Acidiferrobacteraceae bacterium]